MQIPGRISIRDHIPADLELANSVDVIHRTSGIRRKVGRIPRIANRRKLHAKLVRSVAKRIGESVSGGTTQRQ